VLVSVLRSVARRRLVQTENPSVCATVTWNVCKSAIALNYLCNLSAIKRVCNQAANKSNYPNKNPSFRHAYPLHVTIHAVIFM
jgi:hypothetical protein